MYLGINEQFFQIVRRDLIKKMLIAQSVSFFPFKWTQKIKIITKLGRFNFFLSKLTETECCIGRWTKNKTRFSKL